MPRAHLGCAAGAALMIATACSSSELTWRAQPPAPALAGKLVITVADRRVGPQGGDDPRVIGSERGALLIPNTLKLAEPTDAADTIRRMLVGAALTAGVGVAPPGDASGSARLVATLTALGPDGSTRVADTPPLQIEGGGANCRDAYAKMLTDAYSAAVSILMTPPIKAALTGAR